MYHEKQRLQHCGVHAVNNLLQEKAFSKQDFDSISRSLAPSAWINPHRSFLGTGNYDVNVLMMALQSKDLSSRWHDQRRKVTDINLHLCSGLLVNVEERGRIFNSHHWYTIRKIGQSYFDLDSKLQEPCCLGTQEEALRHLQQKQQQQMTQIIMVMANATIQEGGEFYAVSNQGEGGQQGQDEEGYFSASSLGSSAEDRSDRAGAMHTSDLNLESSSAGEEEAHEEGYSGDLSSKLSTVTVRDSDSERGALQLEGLTSQLGRLSTTLSSWPDTPSDLARQDAGSSDDDMPPPPPPARSARSRSPSSGTMSAAAAAAAKRLSPSRRASCAAEEAALEAARPAKSPRPGGRRKALPGGTSSSAPAPPPPGLAPEASAARGEQTGAAGLRPSGLAIDPGGGGGRPPGSARHQKRPSVTEAPETPLTKRLSSRPGKAGVF